MSQGPESQSQRPDGQRPSLDKGNSGAGSYPQAPPPGGYQQPAGGYPAAPGPVGYGPVGEAGYGAAQPPRNGLGIAALVLGILSIPLSVLFGPVGVVVAILAIIFGAVGMNRAKKGRATNRGIALAGLITGVIGAIIGAVFTYIAVQAALDCSNELGTGASQQQISQCVTDKLS